MALRDLFKPVEEDEIYDVEPSSPKKKLSLKERVDRIEKLALSSVSDDSLVNRVSSLESKIGSKAAAGAKLPERIEELERVVFGGSKSESSSASHSFEDDVDKMIKELDLKTNSDDSILTKLRALELALLADPNAMSDKPIAQRISALYTEVYGSP